MSPSLLYLFIGDTKLTIIIMYKYKHYIEVNIGDETYKITDDGDFVTISNDSKKFKLEIMYNSYNDNYNVITLDLTSHYKTILYFDTKKDSYEIDIVILQDEKTKDECINAIKYTISNFECITIILGEFIKKDYYYTFEKLPELSQKLSID